MALDPFRGERRAARPPLARAGTALLLAAVLGCGVPEDSRPPAPTGPSPAAPAGSSAEVLRGHFLFGRDVRSFRPCGPDEPEVWAVDGTGGGLADLVRELAPEPGAPVYAEVSAVRGVKSATGLAGGYPAAVRIEAVRRAYPSGEGPGCDEDLRFLAYRAFGNEPFWSLSVAPDGAVLSTPERDGTRRFEMVEAAPSEPGSRTVRAGAAGQGVPSLLLTLEDGRCVDTMSGARFSFRARVTFGRQRLEGCALEGDASLPGVR